MIFQLLWKKWKTELAEPCTEFMEFPLDLFVNDSFTINHRGLVKCISKTATVLLVISKINN